MPSATALPRAQNNTHTIVGRSDPFLAALADALHGHQPRDALSFGCSRGFECLSLAQAFPRTAINGCDVDDAMLASARTLCAGSARIFRAEDAQLAAHGPYDLVTAFNVLCRYPATKGQLNIHAQFPFDVFEQLITTIDRHLRPGGVLMLYNAQYFFQDSSVAARYAPLPTPDMPDTGFLHRHAVGGERMTKISYVFSDGQELDEAAGQARQDLAQQNGLNLKLMGLVTPRLSPLDDRLRHDLSTLAWRKMA